MERRRG